MLYKPVKPQANQASSGPVSKASSQSPPPALKQQHQHNNMWYRLGQFLSSAINLFGSHQHLDKGLSEDTNSQTKDDQDRHQQSKRPLQPHQQRKPSKHRLLPAIVIAGQHRQHARPSAAVSCQNLARASSTFNRCVVDLTFSDDEDGQHGANRVAKWATGLGHLLSDPDGASVFAEFLRSEFSEENIDFWQAVEEFKRLIDPTELLVAAHRISVAHIGSDAPASVNLDGATVRELQSRLGCGQPPPEPGLFDSAQEHIFNLMRLDSYARFLKSTLYKDCLLCELGSRPLPQPSAEPSPHGSGTSLTPSQPPQQLPAQSDSDHGRRLSRDMILCGSASLLDPSTAGQIWGQQQQTRRRTRQPSFIVAALDLNCEFSDC